MKPASPMEQTARSVASRLREAGFIAYFAGGCVRDLIRGKEAEGFRHRH